MGTVLMVITVYTCATLCVLSGAFLAYMEKPGWWALLAIGAGIFFFTEFQSGKCKEDDE